MLSVIDEITGWFPFSLLAVFCCTCPVEHFACRHGFHTCFPWISSCMSFMDFIWLVSMDFILLVIQGFNAALVNGTNEIACFHGYVFHAYFSLSPLTALGFTRHNGPGAVICKSDEDCVP